MKINYRPEIDGLRAIAVFSVITYHARDTFLPGGFLGVDIFFVISGYLITSLILKELKLMKFCQNQTPQLYREFDFHINQNLQSRLL